MKIKIKKKVPLIVCGSFLQNNFGESIDKHGFMYIEPKQDGWNISHKEIETDYGYFTLKINSLEDLEKI